MWKGATFDFFFRNRQESGVEEEEEALVSLLKYSQKLINLSVEKLCS